MLILALLFVVVPIAELYVFVQMSHAVGFFDALGLLIVVSIVGAWLVKHEGLRTWVRFNEQVRAGKVPSREIADGVCLLLAGALLLAPGFVTDVVGILLLLPPVRAVLRALILRRVTGKAAVVKATYGGRIYDASVHDTEVNRPTGELEP